MKNTILFALTLGLAACASAPLNTPSGHPQAFFAGQTIDTMQNVFVDMGAHLGMTITQQTANTLVMEKPMSVSDQIILGSSTPPQRQLTFTLFSRAHGTEVFLSEAYILNPGSADQEIDPVGDENRDLQLILTKIQSAAVRRVGPFARGRAG